MPTSAFDLSRAWRRLRPERRQALARRPDLELPFATDRNLPVRNLLLDTTVYIDVLRGTTPESVDRLLDLRTLNHSAICLAELTHSCGRLDPDQPGTASILKQIEATVTDIPAHRLSRPSLSAFGEAGILAGLLARHGPGCPGGQETLNDALIYRHAIELGLVVLTRNIRDFDVLDQLWPAESVLFYRTA